VLLAETLPALPAGAASRVKLLPALRNSRSPNWAKEVTWFGGRIAVVLPAGIDSVLLAQKILKRSRKRCGQLLPGQNRQP